MVNEALKDAALSGVEVAQQAMTERLAVLAEGVHHVLALGGAPVARVVGTIRLWNLGDIQPHVLSVDLGTQDPEQAVVRDELLAGLHVPKPGFNPFSAVVLEHLDGQAGFQRQPPGWAIAQNHPRGSGGRRRSRQVAKAERVAVSLSVQAAVLELLAAAARAGVIASDSRVAHEAPLLSPPNDKAQLPAP